MVGPTYLLSSLPYLDINSIDEGKSNNILSLEDFTALCTYTLSDKDAQQVVTAMQKPDKSTLLFVLDIEEYRIALLNIIAQRRHEAIRKGTYNAIFVNDRIPVSADASTIVNDALLAPNPLAREIACAKALWTYLDNCDSKYRLQLENVIVYGYKLKIYHNLIEFQYEKGDKTWKNIVEKLAVKAKFSLSTIKIHDVTAVEKDRQSSEKNSTIVE